MATTESPQIQVLVDSVRDRGEHHAHNVQQETEQTPLLGTSHWRNMRSKLRRACCVKSKAALVILCWNALMTLLVWYLLEFGSVLVAKIYFTSPDFKNIREIQIYLPLLFGILAILYLFYPLAGCLADIKCGRYKTVLYSLWFITWGGVFTCIGTIIINCLYWNLISLSSTVVVLAVVFGLPTLIGIITSLASYIAFSANIIQFGMDQLHDSPLEDSALFIHWFVFSSHVGLGIAEFVTRTAIFGMGPSKYSEPPLIIVHLVPILTLTAIGIISSYIVKYKHQWFLVDTGSRNPYKLVYRVVKFAAQHRTPIRRSAFTYCEDELPSRMDLGKEKYGGPFTTEQVEDVKAFLGILSLLLTLGPLFATNIAAESMLFKFSVHLNYNQEIFFDHSNFIVILFMLFKSRGLTATVIVTLTPTYICLLRPFIHRYIPGMLKRIGLGMILTLCSLLCTFTIDTVGHIENANNHSICFIKLEYDYDQHHLDISVWYLVFPYILNAFSIIFLYISTFEFICAQSPHAMKGLIIGTFFAVKGVFKFVGATLLLIPFLSWQSTHTFPSCGFVYYLINVLVALTGLVTYTWVARRYQYRQRDEPDNIYRYAEEYYDRT